MQPCRGSCYAREKRFRYAPPGLPPTGASARNHAMVCVCLDLQCEEALGLTKIAHMQPPDLARHAAAHLSSSASGGGETFIARIHVTHIAHQLQLALSSFHKLSSRLARTWSFGGRSTRALEGQPPVYPTQTCPTRLTRLLREITLF